MDIGHRLRDARKLKRFTVEQMADIMGVTQPTISRWENGSIDIPSSALMGYISALGLTLSEFFSDQAPEIPPDIRQMVELVKNLTPVQRELITSLIKELAKDKMPIEKLTELDIDIPVATLMQPEIAETTAAYDTEYLLAQAIEKRNDLDYMCRLLEDNLIILTNRERIPLTPEQKTGFIQFIRTHGHEQLELFDNGNIDTDEPLAAHREGYSYRGPEEGIKPELTSLRRITTKLNKVLKKYLQQSNPKKDSKNRLT